MKWMPEWTWKSALYALFRMIALFYIIALTALFFFQERLIFFPEKLDLKANLHFDSPYEERWLKTAGLNIHSLFFKVPQSPGVILYFHGNAGSLAQWGEAGRELAWRSGWSVWLMDYPGYGKSEGFVSSEEQLYQMGHDFLEAATKEFGRVIVYGRSIGSGIAVHAASQIPPVGLILESPYYGLQDLARTVAPWAPLFLLKYHLASYKFLPEIHAPILLLHGNQDEVIPYSQGQKLAKLMANGKFVTIDGGHHNDLSDSDAYWKALKEYLSQLK